MSYSIYHGPVNVGGLPRHLADWQRKQGAKSDFITYEDHTPQNNAHLNLHLEQYSLPARLVRQFLFFLSVLPKYDLFHFYFGQTLLPFNLDLPFLKLAGKKILMTYCGSDIRLMEIEKVRNPYWKLLKTGLNHPRHDARKKRMMRFQSLWVDVFFAPRDIYVCALKSIPPEKVVQDIWFHNTLDLKKFIPEEFSTRPLPVLVHAPSDMGVKGTDYIEKAIENLKREGYRFEYRRLYQMPSEECQRIMREESDIFIDQFLIGGIGNFAMEGMYYGKPVVAYIVDAIKKEYLADCPVVNASIDTLQEKLAWLIENPEARVELGKKGRAYVEKHLDRETLYQQVWDLYHQLMKSGHTHPVR